MQHQPGQPRELRQRSEIAQDAPLDAQDTQAPQLGQRSQVGQIVVAQVELLQARQVREARQDEAAHRRRPLELQAAEALQAFDPVERGARRRIGGRVTHHEGGHADRERERDGRRGRQQKGLVDRAFDGGVRENERIRAGGSSEVAAASSVAARQAGAGRRRRGPPRRCPRGGSRPCRW